MNEPNPTIVLAVGIDLRAIHLRSVILGITRLVLCRSPSPIQSKIQYPKRRVHHVSKSEIMFGSGIVMPVVTPSMQKNILHQAHANWNHDRKTIANTTPAIVATDEMPTPEAPLDVDAAAPADDECVAPGDLFILVAVLAAPLVGVGRFA